MHRTGNQETKQPKPTLADLREDFRRRRASGLPREEVLAVMREQAEQDGHMAMLAELVKEQAQDEAGRILASAANQAAQVKAEAGVKETTAK